MPYEKLHEGYLVSDDSARLQIAAIHAYLTRSYWALGIPLETVARSVENSLCIGIYAGNGDQVGLVRAITDYATFAYLCDVYVLESHRGRGLSKAAMQLFATHPRLQGIRRQHLVTRDAHTLYSQFGFSPLQAPERHLEKTRPNAYTASTPVAGKS